MQLESVEINGRNVPLRAARQSSPSVTTARVVSRVQLTTHVDLSAGAGVFIFRDEHLRLKNLDSEWVTLSPNREEESGNEKR